MRLKNKRTGEIIEFDAILPVKDVAGDSVAHLEYGSLAELNEEWEDYEEPKEYWYIDIDGEINSGDMEDDTVKDMREIGNYFDTREEAEKAVKKLKAWKRLKDKGFRFSKDWVYRYDEPKVKNHTYFEFVAICEDGALFDDLDLLFGVEE